VFFSLLLWGWVFGIVGTFLAVPLTMTLKLALMSYEKTKWLAILLSK
jgi:predicted PurR-regulated permease PerM